MNEWIQTYTGKQFHLLKPVEDEIDVVDIAHALALTNRFGGHTVRPYSVAQHSLLVCSLVPDELKMEALLHDASEAYLGDVVRPLKYALPEYRAVEHRLEAVIRKKFQLTKYDDLRIKGADQTALMMERRDLLRHELSWADDPVVFPDEHVKPDVWWAAESRFLEKYDELERKRS